MRMVGARHSAHGSGIALAAASETASTGPLQSQPCTPRCPAR